MSDDFLTISQLCRRLPGARGAKNVTPFTVARWILVGCPSRTGERVKLPATRAGSRWLIRPADLDHFFAALKGDTSGPPPIPPPILRLFEELRPRVVNSNGVVRDIYLFQSTTDRMPW
jgi:hypothetical protein